MFLENEICILNKLAIKGLPNRIGERCVIMQDDYYRESRNYDYKVQFDDSTYAGVKQIELNKLTDADKGYMGFIFTGNTVIHNPSGVKVKILKVDYLLGQAEVLFDDHSTNVVRFNNLIEAELESDSVEEKTSISNTLIDTFLSQYKNNDDTYTLPKIVLEKLVDRVFEEGE